MKEKLTNCVHRLFGDCQNCQSDLDQIHHPNNYDCSRYTPITVGYFEVRDKEHENTRLKNEVKDSEVKE